VKGANPTALVVLHVMRPVRAHEVGVALALQPARIDGAGRLQGLVLVAHPYVGLALQGFRLVTRTVSLPAVIN
jgi:hypothetical protein